jgi:hypothetical protein
MIASREPTNKMKTLLRQLLAHAAQENRLPAGRCACHEPSVRWCTRHGRPLKADSALHPR